MNIAIVDDDIEFAQMLRQDIEIFMKTLFTKYHIEMIHEQYLAQLLKNDFDILFLDIDLNEFNGIDVGQKICLSHQNPIIIFISSHHDLVFHSLSIRPFYFVRKGNYQDDLSTMLVLLEKYLKDTMTFLTFDFYGRQTQLFLKDIYMLESNKHDMVLKTKHGDYQYRATMKDILEKLGTETIVQFQKAYAVNLDYIQEIDKGVIYLKNGESYNIGRKFKDTFIQKYKEHFLR